MQVLLFLALTLMASSRSDAQTPLRLTLQEARDIAVQRHPRYRAATLAANAADQMRVQQQAAQYPSIEAALTGAGASQDAALGAGALSNSTVLNRAATGLSVRQLLFDFGRNRSLVESARLRAQAAHETAAAVRGRVILEVDRAYFSALRAEALLKVAEQTVATRRLVVDQAVTLQQAGVKSGLDVSLARYDHAESELLLAEARNDLRAAHAELSAAIGSGDDLLFELADVAVPAVPPQIHGQAAVAAVFARPDLRALQFERAAASEFLKAERALDRPTATAIWNAGWIPYRDAQLPESYNAAAVNISIPIFAKQFRAREAEANYRAQESQQRVNDEMNRIARDVRIASLNVDTAYQRVGLAAQLVEQAREALQLAQERYRLGLGSIVELRQTLLNVTVAEIENATARFNFLAEQSFLDYASGRLP
jgi:outer membrane protein